MTAQALRLRDAVARSPWLTTALLATVSAVVLLARLGSPDRIIFDETYYVEDARGYLATGVEPSFAVHPTVGKWLIAAGIRIVGDTPVGWRVTAALAGVATVVLTHLLARRLLAGRRWGPLLAVVAPLLLLADGLFITQSRISMLDAFLVAFVVGGVLLLVVDRDRRGAGGVRPRRPSLRTAAGVVLGLAVATKWSGLLAIGAAGLLTIAWEVAAARRGTSTTGALVSSLGRRGAAVVGSLLVVPAVVYGLTWLPWLASYEHTWASDCEDVEPRSDCDDADASVAERLDGLWRYHDAMLDFHLGLESDHSYRADPLGWVVLQRPVVYYWETCSQDRADGVPTEDEDGELVEPEPCEVPVGTAGEVMAVGNPAVWWGFLLAVPLLVAGAVRGDGRSAVALVAWLALWVPWLFISRTAFLFYLAPSVPFLALGIALSVDRLDDRVRHLGAVAGYAGGALLGFVLAGAAQTLDLLDEGWRTRFVALAVGAAVGATLGALDDRRRDEAAGGRSTADDPPRDAGGDAGAPGPGPDGRAVARAAARPPTDPEPTDARRSDPDRDDAAPATTAPGAVTVLSPEDARDRTTTAAQPAAPVIDVWPRPPRSGTSTAPATDATDAPDDPSSPPPAPLARVPAIALGLVVVTWGLWTFFGPLWYGVPLARDVLEWRWWFSTWI